MRTVFLGTSAFAAAVLRRLAASPHPPALVVSRPDAPKGRGRRLAAPPAVDAARELGIDTFQPERVNDPDAVERVAAARPDALCLCAYGALIREPLLSRFGPIRNVHPSLLPRWRGAAPIERAIMAGDEETGVSIMALTEGMDEGPVCLAAAEPIGPDDTYGTLAPRLERLGGDLLVQALGEDPPFRPQPEEGVTYADRITAADRTLDLSRPAIALERTVRALDPHIGARVELPDGTVLGVRRARPGRHGDLVVEAADGPLTLLVVQPPGGRPMEADAYLRGHRSPRSSG